MYMYEHTCTCTILNAIKDTLILASVRVYTYNHVYVMLHIHVRVLYTHIHVYMYINVNNNLSPVSAQGFEYDDLYITAHLQLPECKLRASTVYTQVMHVHTYTMYM